VFGYAATEVGLLLGLSQAAHLALLKAVVLVLYVCMAIIVVQTRRVVRGWIRPPSDAQGIVARVRNAVAAIWHWIALFYLMSVWLVWAAALASGYELLSRNLLIIIAVVVLARVATRVCVSALERMLQAGTELAPDYPGLDDRLSFYQPFLRLFIKIGVCLAALLLLLQLLGFAALQWLISNPLGQRLAGSLMMLAITFLLALAVWEAVNATIERHLARLTRQAQIAKIARMRTLLPILRTALLISVLAVTTLVVLSEIGVNTAPLLASAGIIGVAIGFGSQKLVQDLITGVFLLLDNTMQVGDVVSVAGLSGVVEYLSVRTIRLRAEDGSVHVIPFSSVTTVTNMTRDYGRAVVQVGIAYKENVDRVIDVLKSVVVEMRADAQWKDIILGDLEVYGLDQFAASAVIIKGRIMCTPFARWSVAREFNRRMKGRFDKLGIEIPLPHQKLILDQPLTVHHTTDATATQMEGLSASP
jgi:small-conductance mechanosensitive channel